MSGGEREEKQWKCGKAIAVANLQRVRTMVRDIGEPCLSQSPIKVVILVRHYCLSFIQLLFIFC
jgi:hypothetical protein